jgi:hypothetical protein
MKIHPVEAEFQEDRGTDVTKPIVAFRNFANAPKKIEFYSCEFIRGETSVLLHRLILSYIKL